MTRWNRKSPAMVAIVLLWAGSGCKGRAPAEVREDAGVASLDAGDGISVEGEFLRPIDSKLFWMAGKEDVENRYPAAVSVSTSAPMEAGVKGHCSGVLLGPELVLTAGHCVCAPRGTGSPGEEGKTIIDGSNCSDSAGISTVVYLPPKKGSELAEGLEIQRFLGRVKVHPEFKLRFDEQKRVVSSHADLAVIILDRPVAAEIAPAHLASSELETGEFITLASYGFDEVIGGTEGRRHIVRYRISKLLADGERVQYEQPSRALYRGDSGGPCFRERGGDSVLVGIANRSVGEEPTLTSTYVYRDWLRAETQRAASARPAPQRVNP